MARIMYSQNHGKFDMRDADEDYLPDEDYSNDEIDYYDEDLLRSRRKTKILSKYRTSSNLKKKVSRVGFRRLVSSSFNKASHRRYTRKEMTTSPLEGRTTFIPFEEVCNQILNPRFLKKRGITSFNTIMPSFDPMSTNIEQFFNLDSTFVPVDLAVISKMTDEELLEELKNTEKDIQETPKLQDMFVFSTPFSEHLSSSISIHADVTTFDWKRLGALTQFDVILMDPPWMIVGDAATRGVDLDYDLMTDDKIIALDIPSIQSNGFIFMWVVASHVHIGSNILEKWGYEFIGCLNWIKTSITNKYAPSNGYYFQHVKETCIIGRKGRNPEGWQPNRFKDIFIERRLVRQSHKPPDLYKTIEEMFPESTYIEVFARPHNLRDGWVSLGLECPP